MKALLAIMAGDMTNSNDLGKILKQRRVTIPLTLWELARASGVSASHLSRIERGKRFPSARILQKFAKPLGFREEELFSFAALRGWVFLSDFGSGEIYGKGDRRVLVDKNTKRLVVKYGV